MCSERRRRARDFLFLFFAASMPLFTAELQVVNAAVSARDWKSPGDGLLTFDNVNQREWLDLTQTLLTDLFPVHAREDKFQYVLAQTAPGGSFEGFHVALADDVRALAQSGGIDTTSSIFALNSGPIMALQDLLGVTHDFPITGTRISSGLLNELPAEPPYDRRQAAFELIPQNGLFGTAALAVRFGDDFPAIPPGVYLYRSIPEPATVWIAMSLVGILSETWR